MSYHNEQKTQGMEPLTVVARTASDMYAWFMVTFGVYVIVHGDMTPGGGFQGGAIVATFLALLLVVSGSQILTRGLSIRIYKLCLFTGLFMFIGLGLMGMGWGFGKTMMYNWDAVSKDLLGTLQPWWPPSGTVTLMDIAVGVEVTGGLSLMVMTMFTAIRMNSVIVDGKGKETGYGTSDERDD